MSNRTPRILTVISILALLGTAVLYLQNLPSTVQTGDTGELAVNSYFYQVSHPSGYPLFVNLQYVFTHFFRFGTVFYRVAFLNAVFSLGALVLLYLSSRNRWLGLGIALCLAFSRLFWQYSELPDVFALNALIAAGLLFFFYRKDLTDRARVWGTCLLFPLGLANHLTVLFLAPVALATLLSVRDRKKFWLPIATGASLFVLSYASLMLMHPDSFYSWGSLKSPAAVMKHFLREDYGRTHTGKEVQPVATPIKSLDSTRQHKENQQPTVSTTMSEPKAPPVGTQFTREVSTAWDHLFSGMTSREFRFYSKHFAFETCRDFSPVLIILVLFVALSLTRQKRAWIKRDWRAGLLFGVLVLYCYVFFSLMKIDPIAENLDVVERFYIFPQLLICFLVLQWLPSELIGKRALAALTLILVAQAGVSLAQNRAITDYSKNAIVEDYACNLLQTAPSDRPSMLLAEDDTQYFALKYCQQVNGVHPETLVVSAPLLFHSWYSKKVIEQNPRFVFDAAKAQETLHFSLEEDLLRPNVKQMSFLVSSHFNDSEHFRLTYRALGRRIEEGRGEFFDDSDGSKFRVRSTYEVIKSDPSEYSDFRRIYGEYAFYHLALGRKLFSESDYQGAQNEYLKALQKVPYCILALENLCVVQHSVGADTSSCESDVSRFKALNFNYFPY